MSERKYFGTDGIRGLVGQWPISADFMLRLGRAVGSVLKREQTRGRPLVLIGKDTRVSGYMFESALEAGLVAAGVDVGLLGPMPTPGVAYLTRSMRAQAGIVISASHNPHYDNGIKFFSAHGEKLSDAIELAIEAEIEADFVTVPSEQLGKASRVDGILRYAEFCKSTLPEDFSLRGMKLVLDCANGATYQVAPKVFAELGAEVSSIGNQPDGFNINRDVGSTHPQALQRAVVDQGADIGIAFDGDGDRLQLVDRHGVLADGDDILYVLARSWLAKGQLHGPVIGTLMSNYGLFLALRELGSTLQRANVGDRYVLQMLKQHDGILGGETSGHILCLDRATTGDGIVAALAVLEALADAGEDLAEARKGLRKFPQVMVNVRAEGAREALQTDAVRTALAEVEQKLQGRGRVVLRASGTEPLVRVTVEAADEAEVRHLADTLAEVVKSAAERL
ncbi:phosphoglucosamine mutase [Dyella sp.]|uniref:phosphoglucosamine mutase n=1 Tax=Dyella sp. TaxID=1869338 RepID=UPI002ED356F8